VIINVFLTSTQGYENEVQKVQKVASSWCSLSSTAALVPIARNCSL